MDTIKTLVMLRFEAKEFFSLSSFSFSVVYIDCLNGVHKWVNGGFDGPSTEL